MNQEAEQHSNPSQVHSFQASSQQRSTDYCLAQHSRGVQKAFACDVAENPVEPDCLGETGKFDVAHSLAV